MRNERAFRDSISNLFSCTIQDAASSCVRILNSISSNSIREREFWPSHMALFLRLHRRSHHTFVHLSFFSISAFHDDEDDKRGRKGREAAVETSFMPAKTLCRSRACIFANITCSRLKDTARYPVCSRTTAERALRLLRDYM